MTAFMRIFCALIAFVLMGWPIPIFAGVLAKTETAEMAGYDVVLLSETHDNPGHHARQQTIVAALQPKAIVWEMLTQQQAEKSQKH